ncbi:hypothetical protein CC1G_07954 [Coprinopsis cinerea okayama7|uniref:Uncharacterized protein n=1 Tax=Coprinopsis cinerea (strain Okayama-7 / 130 / ATCC MYA-4618 / FGSC 9003) TaxID=240176 RepID=A8P206_COPC7|nr:hypothetical protein CC1G_07954 [Coprinopsis cinerea okayama7\|eukprot:XP_001838213.1 hypothetical protein CC1G_07954 [Coprinopsis cinerea okayama7\
MTKVKDGGDPFEILDIHPLFTSIVPRLKRNLGLLPPSQQTLWVKKFARSVHAFVAAQSQIRDNLRENRVPSLQEYLISRREAYASSMFWDLVELLDISPRPNGRNPNEHLKLKRLTQCAVDAVAWAIDVFAYAAPSRCNTYNLISLLTSHKNLSVQGAMNYAGGMVRETLEEFHRLERELVPLTKPDSDGPSSHSHPPATTTSSSTVSPSPSSSGSSNNSRRSSGWGRWLWSIPASLVGDTGTSTSSSSSTAKPTSTGRPYLLGIDPSSRDGWFLGFDTDSSLNSTATTPISDDDGSSSTFDNASLNHSSSSSLDHSSSSSSDHTSPSLPSPTSPTPFDNPDTDLLTTTKNLSRYILSLKDYIVGSIHWGYETELYFGTKGDEIRSFGWVFLS